jgi:hypothetical protein
MILTLDDVQAKVADVFLMLSETQPVEDIESDERIFQSSMDDIAHWCGLSVEECRQVLNHFVTQRRIEIYPDRIIVKNINDFRRFVKSRRNKA